MRVGMYNRWLATLGGGEKLGLSIAETISQKYPVTVITHQPVSKDEAARRLSLDLSRIEFLTIPDRLAEEMTPVTEGYDLFICASFMDYFPSRAGKSALLIYFPSQADLDPGLRLKRRLKLMLRHWFMLPSFVSGLVNLDPATRPFTRWLDFPARMRLPASPKPYGCSFSLSSHEKLARRVDVRLGNELVETLELPLDHSPVECRFLVPASNNKSFQEVTILEAGQPSPENHASVKVIMTDLRLDHIRHRFYRLLERSFRGIAWRLHIVPPGFHSVIESVDSYDAIWAISEFSQKWIWKYWNRSSEILYPPVNVEDYQPRPKKNIILNVGRFFAGNHNKKHLEMIAAFKEMVDEGLTGWEFHLAGGATPGEMHEEYLQQVLEQVKGYPIVVHIDIAFPDLIQLYGESAIYWHASGYGEDEDREPIKFEHFGITTVEGMASGCVPVVIGKGGQPEIVHHGQNGFLWRTIDELKTYTLKVIHNPSLRRQLSEAALSSSRRYDKKNFDARLQKLLEQIQAS
ncbi:MAG: glycosyltransferase [Anaerolineales bacterium]|nr:glycosyltransferase [Anaerolineales bacterium]